MGAYFVQAPPRERLGECGWRFSGSIGETRWRSISRHVVASGAAFGLTPMHMQPRPLQQQQKQQGGRHAICTVERGKGRQPGVNVAVGPRPAAGRCGAGRTPLPPPPAALAMRMWLVAAACCCCNHDAPSALDPSSAWRCTGGAPARRFARPVAAASRRRPTLCQPASLAPLPAPHPHPAPHHHHMAGACAGHGAAATCCSRSPAAAPRFALAQLYPGRLGRQARDGRWCERGAQAPRWRCERRRGAGAATRAQQQQEDPGPSLQAVLLKQYDRMLQSRVKDLAESEVRRRGRGGRLAPAARSEVCASEPRPPPAPRAATVAASQKRMQEMQRQLEELEGMGERLPVCAQRARREG